MSSSSPTTSPAANDTSPPSPETTPPATSNATQTVPPPQTTVPVDSPPPPTQTTMPVDFPPPPPDTDVIPVNSTPTVGALESQSMPHGTVGIIVGVGIGGMSMLIAIAIYFFFYRRSKKKKKMMDSNYKNGSHGGAPMHHQNNALGAASYSGGSYPSASVGYNSGSEVPPAPKSPRMGYGMSQSAFTYEELARATNGFSRENLLGQGGFGYVHKGVLPNGKVVAVKQLKAGSGQGEREFQAEVEIISRVHHRHLVSLVGYCMSGAQRMLIYEFVPNGTMEFHLHGKGNSMMMWSSRMKIAIGSAKGLAYLHEDCQPKIIHRDIKVANILIDNQFEAKVADFGLAKFSSDTDTHVSTRVMGTFGYLAPEYASSGKLTEKSDVFSFGVVLLELITGRYPIDKKYNFADDSMVEWARPLLKEALENGNFKDIIDPKLQNEYNSNEMRRMIACAAASVRHSARHRPRMSQIVRALEGNMPLDELSEGIKPGHSTVYSSSGSQDYNTKEYKQDMEKFRKLALESQELSTGDYSVPSTGSAGLNPGWSTSDGQYTSEEIETDHFKKRGQ